jgi:hypothetical protein
MFFVNFFRGGSDFLLDSLRLSSHPLRLLVGPSGGKFGSEKRLGREGVLRAAI